MLTKMKVTEALLASFLFMYLFLDVHVVLLYTLNTETAKHLNTEIAIA